MGTLLIEAPATDMSKWSAHHHPHARTAAAAGALALLLSACGGDPEPGDPAGAGTVTADAGALAASPEEAAEELVEDLEDAQAAQGGGSASLTVGGSTWDFDSVLCAFGEEQIGQEGAELVVSSIQDGLQFYLSVDSYGHSASLEDVENFQDPSVSLSTEGASDDFIKVDGTRVSGEAGFVDATTDSLEPIAGSFEATCP